MAHQYRFQDSALPIEERARDLVSHLTLEEKIGMVTSNSDAIPRLGIPKTHFGVEIARGLVQRDQQRETTILPQPWGLAATFDPALMEELGDLAGDEVRVSSQMAENPSSLVLFGPTVDMERDPRWGRNEEAYGEDPCLTGRMTAAYTRGLAGNDPKYIKCAPLLKHFYANNSENQRQTTNANITPRLKYDYYLKAFEPAIREGGAAGLMTAYNLINGVEGVNNPDVTEICKKKWGMQFAVSDGGDFGQNVASHRSYENHAESIGDILGQGADMMLDSRDMVDPAVREALQNGSLTEERLDRAITDQMKLRFLLGDFDPLENPYAHMDPSKLASKEHKALAVRAGEESVILLENKGLLPLKDDGRCSVAVVGPLTDENYICWYCGYAAEQTSIVKGLREKLGEERILFDEGFDHIVIKARKNGRYVRLGEDGALVADALTAAEAEVFERNDWDFGAWTLRSLKNRRYVREDAAVQGAVAVNPAMRCVSEQAFGWFVMELVKSTEENGVCYLSSWQDREIIMDKSGCLVSAAVPGNGSEKAFEIEIVSNGKQRCAALAAKADYAVVCGGNHPLINAREEYDRPDIRLPHEQSALLDAVCAANQNTLLYLVTGYPFAIAEEREKAAAVLCSTHIGPSLGHVAAKTIFGGNNPAGRTPSTWYRSLRDLPDLEDYDIAKNKTTYLYFEGEPLYPFGYGLSYTQFTYGGLRLEKPSYKQGEIVNAIVTVTNTGSCDGDEVVQLYTVPPKSVFSRPKKQLKAFSRVHVPAGASVEAVLSFPVNDLAFWSTQAGVYLVEQGEYRIALGASSQDIRCEQSVWVEGAVITGRDACKRQNAIDADDYRRVQFLTDKRDGVPYLEAADFRSFAVYRSLALQDCNAFEAVVSSPAGNFELVLADNETGEILGTCKSVGTGGLTRFHAVCCEVAPTQGLVDLRICFTKQSSLKSFHFYRKS